MFKMRHDMVLAGNLKESAHLQGRRGGHEKVIQEQKQAAELGRALSRRTVIDMQTTRQVQGCHVSKGIPVHVGPMAHFAEKRLRRVHPFKGDPIETTADKAVPPPVFIVVITGHIHHVRVRILARHKPAQIMPCQLLVIRLGSLPAYKGVRPCHTASPLATRGNAHVLPNMQAQAV